MFDTPCFALWNDEQQKKKNLSTVAAKGRKGLRKGHAPARAMYAWKERGCSYIRVHGHTCDCFQNTVGKVDM